MSEATRLDLLRRLIDDPGVERIARAELSTRTVIVVELSKYLTSQATEDFMAQLRAVFPEPQRIIVCSPDVRLSLIEEAED